MGVAVVTETSVPLSHVTSIFFLADAMNKLVRMVRLSIRFYARRVYAGY